MKTVFRNAVPRTGWMNTMTGKSMAWSLTIPHMDAAQWKGLCWSRWLCNSKNRRGFARSESRFFNI